RDLIVTGVQTCALPILKPPLKMQPRRHEESSWLSAFGMCRSLLQVRRDSLARVGALEQQLLQLAFERKPFAKSGLDARLHGALDASDCPCRLVRRGELPRVLLHRRGERPAGKRCLVPDLGDQPN